MLSSEQKRISFLPFYLLRLTVLFFPDSLHLAIKCQLFFFVQCFPFCLCDSAKIIRKLMGWKRQVGKSLAECVICVIQSDFCKRLRFAYTLVRMGVLHVAFVTCSSEGKIARKDLLINVVVVALLVEGAKLVLVAFRGSGGRRWQFTGSNSGSALVSSRFC